MLTTFTPVVAVELSVSIQQSRSQQPPMVRDDLHANRLGGAQIAVLDLQFEGRATLMRMS